MGKSAISNGPRPFDSHVVSKITSFCIGIASPQHHELIQPRLRVTALRQVARRSSRSSAFIPG